MSSTVSGRSGLAWVPVRSVRGCFSVWPDGRPVPDGWRHVGPVSSRSAALDLAARLAESAEDGPAVVEEPEAEALKAEAEVETVDARFDRWARTEGARVAVRAGDREITYAGLARRAAEIRAGLIHLGVRRGDAVGVCLDRGPDLIAVLLAVIAAGAAYVPLDAGYPAARLDFMVRDARVRCVVTAPEHWAALAEAGVPTVDVARLRGEPVRREPAFGSADDLAYIMFTSGSTGRSKSVEVTHRNLSCFVDAMIDVLPAGAGEQVLFSTAVTFDIAGLEIFLPLVTGGCCLVAPQLWLPRMRSLARLVNMRSPSLVQATPVQWRMLLEAGATFGPDQTVLCGGDALPAPTAALLAALPARAFNVYGPTEATVWATAAPIVGPVVSIGDALPHARVHVLDDRLVPVPEGTEGEAYIAGDAVTRGYRGQHRLTAERYLPDPWSPDPGARMYTTGDVVRGGPAGLVWLRRRDTQAKVNGHRIELGELESAAAAVDGVRAAVAVVVREDETAALHLFVEVGVTPDGTRLSSAVRDELARTLPPAMLPRRIELLEALPLTANGKVDRGALERGLRR